MVRLGLALLLPLPQHAQHACVMQIVSECKINSKCFLIFRDHQTHQFCNPEDQIRVFMEATKSWSGLT